MANSKKFVVKNGLETQNIQFVEVDGTETITLTVLEDGSLSFSGSSGQLFSIADSLTGTIFSVNDISGIPSIEVFDDGKVILAESTGNVGIGTASPTEKLEVSGTIKATALTLTGGLTVGGDLTINGTTTNINTTNLVVEDKNIILGDVTTPSDVTADGGGITLKGATDKTITWVDSTDRWTSNQVFGAPNFVSTVATGTQPYATTSTTLNTNLNADLLDGNHAAAFATASHAHGDITNAGAITTTVVTPANGDNIIIADSSASDVLKRGITIGTSTDTFLRNDGSWSNPRTSGKTYSSLTGSTGQWFDLFTIGDASNGALLVSIHTYAHGDLLFAVSSGYGPSAVATITILNCVYNPSGGYAQLEGVRVTDNGLVQIQLAWSSGPTVDIEVSIFGQSTLPTLAASLTANTTTYTINDTVSLSTLQGKIRSENGFVSGTTDLLTEINNKEPLDNTIIHKIGTITNQDWNTYIDGTEASWVAVSGHTGSNRPSSSYTYGLALNAATVSEAKFQLYVPETGSSGNGLWYRTGWDATYRAWVKIWDSGNDGIGSTLDADLLDGQEGTYYLNYNNFTNTPTIPTVNDGTLTLATSGTGLSGSATFTANQSGNSTFTVTSNATPANTASTIVSRSTTNAFAASKIYIGSPNNTAGSDTTGTGYIKEDTADPYKIWFGSDTEGHNLYIDTLNQEFVGPLNGNALTVTNGVYTNTNQTITGTKTFTVTKATTFTGTEVRSLLSGGSASTTALDVLATLSSNSTNQTTTGLYVTSANPGTSGSIAYGIVAQALADNGSDWGLIVKAGGTHDHLRFKGTINNAGSNRYVEIFPASLSASRSYTLPDVGANADFVMTQGNQTIAGTKTFSSTISGSINGNAATATTATTATNADNVKLTQDFLSGTGPYFIPMVTTNANGYTSLYIDSSADETLRLEYNSNILDVPHLSIKGTTRTAGVFYSGNTAPVSSNRLNYDGDLYATDFVGNGEQLVGSWRKVYGSGSFTNIGSGTGVTSITLTESHNSYDTYLIQFSDQGVTGGPPPATTHTSVIVTLYSTSTSPTTPGMSTGWLKHSLGTTSTVNYFVSVGASSTTMYFSNKYSQVQYSSTASTDTIASATTMYVRNIYKLVV